MKRREPELHIYGSDSGNWVRYRTAFIVFVLACLIAWLIALLMDAIHVNITTGQWPLFN